MIHVKSNKKDLPTCAHSVILEKKDYADERAAAREILRARKFNVSHQALKVIMHASSHYTCFCKV